MNGSMWIPVEHILAQSTADCQNDSPNKSKEPEVCSGSDSSDSSDNPTSSLPEAAVTLIASQNPVSQLGCLFCVVTVMCMFMFIIATVLGAHLDALGRVPKRSAAGSYIALQLHVGVEDGCQLTMAVQIEYSDWNMPR